MFTRTKNCTLGIAALSSLLCFPAWAGLAEFTDFVRTFKAVFDPYRPELHYMRGPGPKWHAKHDPGSPTRQVPPLSFRL